MTSGRVVWAGNFPIHLRPITCITQKEKVRIVHPQNLPDGDQSPGHLISGIMTQWRLGRISVFANLENVLDARQSRTNPLVSGPRSSPAFPPVWGPTDGFIANGGLLIDF